MLDYIQTTERIIGDIKKIENVEKVVLKELVLELATHLEQGIIEKRPEVIAKLNTILAKDSIRVRGKDGITVSMVSLLIKKIKNDNFPSLSLSWIEKVLPDKYKEVRVHEIVEKMILPEEISDGNLLQMAGELKKRIRKIQNLGPAKEIKVKQNQEDLEEFVWSCPMAHELVKLAIKSENEHELEHSQDYCEKSAHQIRMTRDKRFTTTFSRYHAIVVQAEHTRSLANLAGAEVEVLSRWQVADNEANCRECLDMSSCRASKCNHGCHQFKKKLTTKGINWAMRENEELKTLKNSMERLSIDSNDMCEMMRLIFINNNIKMTQGDKKTIMATHMKVDDCHQCVGYEMNNPNFFKEHLHLNK